METKQSVFSNETENKTIHLERDFDVSLDRLWMTWTKKEILDHWWAPKPYTAETKTLSFKEGGHWLYAMVASDGTKQWTIENFERIDPNKMIVSTHSFCDAEGHPNAELPVTHWKKEFKEQNNVTLVTIKISFDSTDAMDKILRMGFEDGFTASLNNLEEYLEKH